MDGQRLALDIGRVPYRHSVVLLEQFGAWSRKHWRIFSHYRRRRLGTSTGTILQQDEDLSDRRVRMTFFLMRLFRTFVFQSKVNGSKLFWSHSRFPVECG